MNTKEIDVSQIHEHDRLWALKKIHIQEAWKVTKGRGIKIAVLDSGASLSHPDLKKNIILAKDFTDSKYGAEDVNGHGSHVAGIIAAIENGKGVVGVAPESKLMIAKVLKDNGKGDFDSVIKAIEWAIEEEADIITMSLGARKKVPELLHYTIRKAYKAGIIMFAAAGNSNEDVAYPAAYEEVIAISAVDENNHKADFSNFGIANEIAAPGTNLLSSYKNKGYAILSGTSMATPIVAGAGALFMSAYLEKYGKKPCLNKTRTFVRKSIVDFGEEGRDNIFGEGVLSLHDFEKNIHSFGECKS